MRLLSRNDGGKTNTSERCLHVSYVERRKLARKFSLFCVCHARVSTSNNAGMYKDCTDILYVYKIKKKLMRNLHLLCVQSSSVLGVVVAVTR